MVASNDVPTNLAGNPGLTRRAKVISFLLALGVSAVSIWAAAALFGRKPPPASPQAAGLRVQDGVISLSPTAPHWKVLKLGKVTPATAHQTDALPARIRIDETRASRVGTPLNGRVVSVFVELGQRVKVGTPLFAVASPDLSVLRAEKDKSEVDLAASKTTLDRVRAMVAARALPAKEELGAVQSHRQAEVARRLALSKLASLRITSRSENQFTVVSRRDGVVVEKRLLPSQEVAPETDKPLLMIADLSNVWVVVDLHEADAMHVATGSLATVTSPALPGQSFSGKVEMVSSVVDPERHTIPIRVQLANPDGLLRPNMYAQVRFQVQHSGSVVEVAATAIVSDGERQHVFVQGQRGQFSRRQVTAGSAHDGRIAVFSGLRLGDVVVEEGSVLLENQLAIGQ